MRIIIVCVLLHCCLLSRITGQRIVQAEYFFNTEPGLGSGINLPLTAGDSVTLNATIPITTLLPGFHYLYTRFKDEAGKWSMPEVRGFYIVNTTVATPAAPPVLAEYFFDSDPGQGAGTALAINAGDSVTVNAAIPVTLLTDGFHNFYIRFRDANGRWSLPESRGFYIDRFIAVTNGNLVTGEYFLDTDPGIGNGVAINVPAATDSVTVALQIPGTGLSAGFHNLYTRFKDATGKWSNTETRGFYIDSAGLTQPEKLSGAEYFFDADPGQGSGIALLVTVGTDSLNNNFSIPLTGLTPGFHNLHIRYRNEGGKWSHPESKAFYIDSVTGKVTGPIVAGEYYIGTDPGIGNGTAFTITPGDSVDIDMMVTADSSLPLGIYPLSIRVQDKDGIWSHAEVRTIKVCSTYGAMADFEIVRDNNRVSLINNSQYANLYRWFFGDGDTSRIEKPYHEYKPGNYNLRLIASNPCGADTLQKALTIEGLDNIYPNFGGNTGVVTALLKGFGFKTGTTVNISNGSNTLRIDSIKIVNGDKIAILLNLNGVSPGKYTITVTIPGVTGKFVIPDGFTVENGKAPAISATLNVPPIIRAGRETQVLVTVTNQGNNDASGVPVFISGFPLNASLKVMLDSVPVSKFNHLTPDFTDTSVNFIIKDTIEKEQLVAMIIPTITPGRPFVIPIYITAIQAEMNLEVSVLGPEFEINGPSANNRTSALPEINTTCGAAALLKTTTDVLIEELEQGDDGILEFLIKDELAEIRLCARNAYKLAAGIRDEFTGSDFKDETEIGAMTGAARQAISWYNHFSNGLATTLTCGRYAIGFLPPARVLKYASKMYKARTLIKRSKILGKVDKGLEWADRVTSLVENYQECDQKMNEQSNTAQQVSVRQSFDPNIKLGPGTGSRNYLSSKDRIGYSILFENQPGAGLPAQTVVVLDTINKQLFDINSFRFTSFSIGTGHYYITDADKSFIRTVDLRPRLNLKVRVNGHLDTATGILRCEYQTIDPLTNQVTTDPIAGFLLPNNLQHQGEGGISYSIEPAVNITTGDVIKNRAAIYFDFNDPIITNFWTNTFDLLNPISQVEPLPAISTSDTLFLKLTGSDNLSGISHYELYAKEDSGQYILINPYVQNGKDTIIGRFGKTYHFYSVAIDTAGNREAMPAKEDAITKIYYSTKPQIDIGLYPAFSVTDSIPVEHFFFKSLLPGNKYIIQVTDSTGNENTFKTIYEFSSTNLTGLKHIPLPDSIPCGIGYRLRMISTNSSDTSGLSKLFRIYNAPKAFIQAPIKETACIGQTILLKADTIINARYQWLKDGVVIQNANQLTYSATLTGAYQVSVSAQGGCTTLSMSRNLVFNNSSLPQPVISYPGKDTLCGKTVILSSSIASNNQWLKDGEIIPGATNQQLLVNNTGLYQVKVSNTAGCTETSTAKRIVIYNKPDTPAISTSGSLSLCEGQSVVLTSSISTGNQWYRNGIKIDTAIGISLLVKEAGSYTCAINTGGPCTASSTSVIVQVSQLPALPVVTASGVTTFCDGGSVTLTSSATEGNQWYKDGVAISGATSKTYVVSVAGNYTVKVTNAGNCTAISAITTVTVNSKPPVPVITTGGPITFCQGGSVTLTSSAASGNQWYKDDAVISGATGTNYTVTASGSYTVHVVNGSGCSAISAPVAVTINTLPVMPVITSSGATTFCEGGNVILTSSAASGNQWYKDGVIINAANNNTYTATSGGNYTVHVSNATACVAISGPVTVTVNPKPAKPVISRNNTDLESSAASGNQWYSDGTLITGATSKTYRPSTPGAYTVQVTQNDCVSPLSDQYYFLITAVTDPLALENTVQLFPNPIKDKLYIRNQYTSKVNVQLYDITGKKVRTVTIGPGTGSMSVKDLTNGTYMVLVTDEKTKKTFRKLFLKQ